MMLVCPAILLGAGLSSSVAIVSAPAGSKGPQGVSQGSIATHPYVDVSEGPSPGYSQVVDNGTEGRFEASGWRVRFGDEHSYGGDYAYVQSLEDGAPCAVQSEDPSHRLLHNLRSLACSSRQ